MEKDGIKITAKEAIELSKSFVPVEELMPMVYKAVRKAAQKGHFSFTVNDNITGDIFTYGLHDYLKTRMDFHEAIGKEGFMITWDEGVYTISWLFA